MDGALSSGPIAARQHSSLNFVRECPQTRPNRGHFRFFITFVPKISVSGDKIAGLSVQNGREMQEFPAVVHPQHKRLHDDALISSKLRQQGRYCSLADLVESRKTTLFCSDFRIRAYFGHYCGENRFSWAFLHNITGIMLFQLDLSRISHEICSSNTPLGESLCKLASDLHQISEDRFLPKMVASGKPNVRWTFAASSRWQSDRTVAVAT